ncbi:hypothetical protein D3C79_805730 [compost metagenome]
MLHLPLHATGLGHVGAEFETAQGQSASWCEVVDLLGAHGCGGGNLAVQGVQSMTQGDDQVLGNNRRARELAGNERVEVMAQLAGLVRMPVDIVHGLDGQHL